MNFFILKSKKFITRTRYKLKERKIVSLNEESCELIEEDEVVLNISKDSQLK